MTYQRQGLGAMLLAALSIHASDPRAQATADEAQQGLNELRDRLAVLAEELAANEHIDETQATDLTNISADLDDLAGTLQQNNVLVNASTAPAPNENQLVGQPGSDTRAEHEASLSETSGQTTPPN